MSPAIWKNSEKHYNIVNVFNYFAANNAVICCLYKAILQELIRHILRKGESFETMADKLMAQITVLKQSVVLDNVTFALIRVNTEGIANE